MTIAYVKDTPKSGSQTLAVTSTGGHCLVLPITIYSTGNNPVTLTSVADSTGTNTWVVPAGSKAGIYYATANYYATSAIAYCLVAAAITNVTLTLSATLTGSIFFDVAEFSGLPAGAVVDAVSASAANATGTSQSTPSISTSGTADLVIAVSAEDTGWTSVSGTSATWHAFTTGGVDNGAYEITTAAGSQQATFSGSSQPHQTASIIAFGVTTATRTAALTVTPTFTAPTLVSHFRTAALTVTPTFAAGPVHAQAAALTVTPTFAAAGTGTGTQTRTAALTVTPSFTAPTKVSHFRTASLAVTPAFTAAAQHATAAALTVTPSFTAGTVRPKNAALTITPSFTAGPSQPALPPAVVQTSPVATGHAVSTLTCTLGSAATAGNCVVVALFIDGSATVSSVKLGGSADNFAAAETEDDTSDLALAAIWADPDCAGGSTAVLITFSGTANGCAAVAYEVSGLATSLVADKTSGSSAAGTAGTSFTSGTTGTTAVASEIAFGVAGCYPASGTTAPTFSGPSGYTNTSSTAVGDGNHAAFIAGYKVLSSTGTVTYNSTISRSSSWVGAVATLKSPSAKTATAALTVTPSFAAATIRPKTASLTVTPSFAAAAAHIKSAALTVTPAFAVARVHAVSPALTVTPSFTVGTLQIEVPSPALTVTPSFSAHAIKTGAQTSGAALTVTPSFTAHGIWQQAATAALTVTPSFIAHAMQVQVRSPALMVTPVFGAVAPATQFRNAALTVTPSFASHAGTSGEASGSTGMLISTPW